MLTLVPHTKPIRSQKVTRSAKGKPCAIRLPGICNNDPETTVWAHLNGGAFGKGMGTKAHDIFGFHACFACHAYVDIGHGTRPLMSDAALFRYLLEAVCETWLRLVRAGILTVPEDVEKPASERPVKPRKRSGRKISPSRKLQSRNDLRRTKEV